VRPDCVLLPFLGDARVVHRAGTESIRWLETYTAPLLLLMGLNLLAWAYIQRRRRQTRGTALRAWRRGLGLGRPGHRHRQANRALRPGRSPQAGAGARLRQRVEILAPAEQWRLVELIAQSLATHCFLLCHPDKAEADYRLDFATDAWLNYVPSLRYPARLSNTSEPEGTAWDGNNSTATPWRSVVRRLTALPRAWRESAKQAPAEPVPLTISRRWHSSKLSAFEGSLIMQVDGKRPIDQLITGTAPSSRESSPEVREFFRRMADWDHLQFQIP
jgi:hypothetical protein